MAQDRLTKYKEKLFVDLVKFLGKHIEEHLPEEYGNEVPIAETMQFVHVTNLTMLKLVNIQALTVAAFFDDLQISDDLVEAFEKDYQVERANFDDIQKQVVDEITNQGNQRTIN